MRVNEKASRGRGVRQGSRRGFAVRQPSPGKMTIYASRRSGRLGTREVPTRRVPGPIVSGVLYVDVVLKWRHGGKKIACVFDVRGLGVCEAIFRVGTGLAS